MKIKKVADTAKDKGLYLANHVASHWSTPAKGNEVPYKEIANYSVGGMGLNFILYLCGQLALTSGSLFLGSALGLRPMHIQLMSMASVALSLLYVFIRAYLFDNLRLKMGKFRPLIMLGAIPVVVLSGILFTLDFEIMTYTDKLVSVGALVLAIEFFKPILSESFLGIGQVMTSSTSERTNVITIYSIIYSFAPTVCNLFVPLFSEFTGGLTSVDTYKYIVLPIGIVGVFLSLFAVLGTKERIVKSKNYVQKINVFKGMKAVYKNKYWWITNTAAWVGFLEGAAGSILMWMYIYGIQDTVAYAFIITLMGFSATIAMVLTPMVLKNIGVKNLLLLHNIMNIVLFMGMLLAFKIPVLFIMFSFLNNLFNFFTVVYSPVINAEVKDYQHYLSGKRMDGAFGPAGAIINIPIVMATGLVIPMCIESFGMTINYNILYDPGIRDNIFSVLLGMSIVGAIMNVVPFFFYDYPREMHVNVIRVINLRATIEDYSDECLEPERIKRSVEDYRNVKEIMALVPEDIQELKFKQKKIQEEYKLTMEAKDTVRRTKISEIGANVMLNPEEKKAQLIEIDIESSADIELYKTEYKVKLKDIRKRIKLALDIQSQKIHADRYMNELHKYDLDVNKIKLEISKETCGKGIEAYVKRDLTEMISKIKAIIESYISENNIVLSKKDAKLIKLQVKALKKCHRKINSVYGDKFVRQNMNNLNAALEISEDIASKEREILVKLETEKWNKYNDVTNVYSVNNALIDQEAYSDVDEIKLIVSKEACGLGIEAYAKRNAEEMLSSINAAVKAYLADKKIVLSSQDSSAIESQVEDLMQCHKQINKVYGIKFVSQDITNLELALAMPWDTDYKQKEKENEKLVRFETKKWDKYTDIIDDYRESRVLIKQKIALDNFLEIESMYDDSIIAIAEKEENNRIEHEENKRIKSEEFEIAEAERMANMTPEKLEKYKAKKDKQKILKERIDIAIKQAVENETKAAEQKAKAKKAARLRASGIVAQDEVVKDGNATQIIGTDDDSEVN